MSLTAAAWVVLSLLALGPAAADGKTKRERTTTPPQAVDGDEESRRVVLVALPDMLDGATRVALTPWQIACVSITESMPLEPASAVEQARALATEHRAKVVIWLKRDVSDPSETVSFAIYDADGERLLRRPLASPPPYDEPTAAALALSLKTLLRHSQVAPRAERLHEPPDAVVEVTALAPAQTAGTLMSRRSSFEASMSVLVRMSPAASRNADGQAANARLRLGVAWWPAFAPAALGFSTAFEVGSGQQISDSGFTGSLDEIAASLALMWQVWQRERLGLLANAGLGLRRSSLDGTVQPNRIPISSSSWLPQLELGALLRMSVLPSVSVGLQLGTQISLRTASYRLPDSLQGNRAGRVVAETAWFSFHFGGLVVVHL